MKTKQVAKTFDSKAHLKTKTMKELMELRKEMHEFNAEHQNVNNRLVSYESLIDLEISSRIGK